MIGITRFLLAERGAALTLAMALAIGVAYAVHLLGVDFIQGTALFWIRPRGFMGGQIDMSSVVSAYYWFIQDGWRWPLMRIPQANWPDGSNVFALDAAPLVALLGKLVRDASGWQVNLYPAWFVAAFALPGVMLAAVLRAWGQRSLLAGIMAGVMGALAPMVHLRFGHVAQMAIWLVVAALAMYAARDMRGRQGWLLGLTLLAGCVNLYLFVMVAAAAGAAILQAVADRRIGLARFLVLAICLPLCGLLPVWAFGLLDMPNLTSTEIDFGFFSANLGTILWPQVSAVGRWTGLSWLSGGPLDGTDGQYEGYAYLGLGGVLLVLVALAREWRAVPGILRRHWALALALGALLAWALSNEVYLGEVMLLRVPLPQVLLDTVLAWFRSSGRFVWPLAWLVLAWGIAGTLRARPGVAVATCALALALQWADLGIWRERLQALVTSPPASVFGDEAAHDAVAREVAARGLVSVVPSFFCSSSRDNYEGVFNTAAAEVQVMAARANARMRWTMTARGTPDCASAATGDLRTITGDGVLIVLADPARTDRTAEARRELACRDFPLGTICVARP